jgi:fumarate hydratase subunit alpha
MNGVREIDVQLLHDTVRELCISANQELRRDHLDAIRRAVEEERSPVGREVLCRLLENADVAARDRVALCQDTGYAVVFLDVGQDVRFVGGELGAAIDRGVADGYRDGFLRASLVRTPIDRRNTGDNTPAIVYYDIVPGTAVQLTLLVKGAGCDNMSALRMLTPAEGLDAMKAFVVETIERAGPSASPPVTVGIGLGGTFERAALLAKRALTRTSGQSHPDPEVAALERELVEAINATGIGPAGFGGTVTTFAVHVETFPTHIASFPVAINIDCHSHRVREVVL